MNTTVNLLSISANDTNGIIQEIRYALDNGVRPAAVLTVYGMNKCQYDIAPDGNTFMEVPAELPDNCKLRLTTGVVGELAALRFPLNTNGDENNQIQ